VLKQLQLETKPVRLQTGIGRVDLDDRCAADVRADEPLATRDELRVYGGGDARHGMRILNHFTASLAPDSHWRVSH